MDHFVKHLAVQGEIHDIMQTEYFQSLQITFYFIGGISSMLTVFLIFFIVEISL